MYIDRCKLPHIFHAHTFPLYIGGTRLPCSMDAVCLYVYLMGMLPHYGWCAGTDVSLIVASVEPTENRLRQVTGTR